MLPSFISPAGTNPGFPAFIRLSVEAIAPTASIIYAQLEFVGADAVGIEAKPPSVTLPVYLGTVSLSRSLPNSLEISSFAALVDLMPQFDTIDLSAPLSPTLAIRRQASPSLESAIKIGADMTLETKPVVVTLDVSLPTVSLTYVNP